MGDIDYMQQLARLIAHQNTGTRQQLAQQFRVTPQIKLHYNQKNLNRKIFLPKKVLSNDDLLIFHMDFSD
ncbi:MAG: hypothetical protein PF489_07135, partial [Salinivirgaceae bacterium]|nr:hypothetical protein [Salinivirgaceae bacterium]